ncbi:outer membrane protein assembly factor BamA [Chelativorans sp. M5D2P16]|uniref:outer membrane protein assembly factor BamA n=1 Tax=Chelativorans sp. M5D2P16 TaxID=3095678 RepID=UPI002ACAF15A|nr:outer membrane protein assembly factor BamA [Chelativorans sp. M5D2P16]MDZ5696409.1 outer membrane protein assembly factor BamA [Chelativorans sp. M5D2P16]
MKAASRFMSAVSVVALSAGFVAAGAIAVQVAAVTSAQAATVSRIEVRGNQRVDAETVRNQVGISPGQNFTNADIDEAVKRLFATGLFANVSIRQAGGALVVTVDEHAIVNQVLFQGNRKIKDRNLEQAVQLQPRGAFSNQLMEADAEAVREAYRRIGRDDAIVNPRVQQLEGGRVNVIFEIQEGERTKIASISFVGNEAFSDRRLRDLMSTKASNFLTSFMRRDIYDEQRLRADEEALRRFYFNHGYADFRIISSSADLVDNQYNVTFTVDEGERYTFGDIRVESAISDIDVNTLQSHLETRSGAIYSAEDVEQTLVGLTEELAGRGYAFAEVTPRGNRDFQNRTISVVYDIDEGPRAYVERIQIRGNTRTRDYVIRREFDVSEGDAFNRVLVQRAKRRLERLDFFQTVNITTVPGSQPDQVVLVVDVVEKATGEFSIGAGYTTGGTTSSDGGFSLEGSITERNFLGRGQFIRLAAAGGEHSRDFTFSFTEPYFLGRRIAAGFDIFRNTRTFSNSDNNDIYDREATGGTIRFGLPITDALTAQLAYNYSQEEYERVGDAEVSTAIEQALEQGKWIKSSVSGSLIYNTLDDMKNPREGMHANFTTEVAGLGGDAQWLKVTARANYYHMLSDRLDLVGLMTVGGGHIVGFGDEDLRIFDQFNSNTRIIRGFKYNGIGPFETTPGGDRDYLGGTTYFHATAEAQFPVPVVPESFGLRGAVFADAATLYGSDYDSPNVHGTDMEWRASVGASLIWASPFGPLRVDYAEPIVKEDTDRIQHWNFGISTRF